ncbi:Armadillo-like helical [Cynara cardunculus var. scolymus]|uniref:Armadillo-like helical n=1 Tax=Cynara cardunculus var. scolymus TaxID=59895 RepID=A0A103Y2T2_CYNCS|nr:Armadillo-like helical [Cynara cardunculus var. scolymus]
MKMQTHLKSRGTTTRVIFELKQRVLLALNKISDRDTYQIGVEELERSIKCLSPEGVSPFLSCILDTDSDQKKAVRKECIRLMGMLATFHQDLIGPHIGKMAASIVKRLKDPDSVVRDACVETMGILASKLSSSESQLEGSFVVLVRPLFEAISEQNKHVQCGSALCLARVIDNATDPPVSILQRMLEKTTKLLNNPRFLVKPAIIELNRSIIQVSFESTHAGGASTQNTLTAAMTSIQEALKNSDWRTRKAASSALAEIASTNGLYFGSFKSSCIRSLELCRFDKVKPVRDTVLQTLQLWRNLKGTVASELPEAGSFTTGGDYSDILSARESAVKNTSVHRESVEKRVPLSVRKNCHSYVGSPQHSNANDWNIEVSVPNTRNVSLAYAPDGESEGSSVTKTYERTRSDITSTQDIGFEYVPMDDKLEFFSASNIKTEKFEAKLVPTTENCQVKGKLVNSLGVNQFQVDKEMSTEEQRYFAKIEGCRSLDSTITESSSETHHGCCMQTAMEIAFFREKLIDIENKQSNLLDLLQLKVSSLEHVVDRMAQNFIHGERHSESTVKFLTRSSTTAAPRLSTCTPRISVDIRNRKSPLQPPKQADASDECTFGRGKSGNYDNQRADSWMDPTSRNHASLNRNGDAVFSLDSGRCNDLQVQNSLRKVIKGRLSQGDIEAAYIDALNSGDEVVLFELLDKTGPVLERLSPRTANVIVSTLASFLSEQQFMISIIPWLQQMVDLSSVHGPNHLVLTAKTRREFLCAIEEAVNMEFPNAMARRSITQLVIKLQNFWGK